MEKLFKENTNLVYKVYHDKFRKLSRADDYKEDLIQIGMMSLWKCCTKFDASRGVTFATYAYSAIYKSMLCFFSRELKKTSCIISLSLPISVDQDGIQLTYGDVVSSRVNIASQVELDNILSKIFEELESRNQEIIKLVISGYTQTEIAEKMYISKSRVSKILKDFKKRLKNTLFLDE